MRQDKASHPHVGLLVGLLALLGCATSSAVADEPAPLRYTTSWLGNSFGGGPDWVQDFAESLCVLPDGTCALVPRPD